MYFQKSSKIHQSLVELNEELNQAGVIQIAAEARKIVAFFGLESVIHDFGLVPDQRNRYGGLTLLTSFFLHGGILHLVGNK